MTERAKLIEAEIRDLVCRLFWDDRKSDESLPSGSIEEAVRTAEVQVADIVKWVSEEVHEYVSDLEEDDE